MYKLSPIMVQNFQKKLNSYHQLFTGGRCTGWELEELLLKAIQSDTKLNHHVKWREAGHDDKADLTVTGDNGVEYLIQVKSGTVMPRKKVLKLSGHRLGRFEGDLKEITDYLNNRDANMLSVPCTKSENDQGRQFIYRLFYVDTKKHLQGLDPNKWKKVTKSKFVQNNNHGVQFSLHPTMSWQIWWEIPLDLIEGTTEEFIIK